MNRISDLYARQDGLATMSQLRNLEVTAGFIRQRIATGEWERIDRRVVGVASATVTWQRQVRAALLSAGDDAAVSGPTAARLHLFDGFDRNDRLHITTFGRRHHTALSGVSIHRSGVLIREQCELKQGMLCVRAPFTLIQIAASNGSTVAGRALDGLLRTGVHPATIQSAAAAWRRKGVVGPALVLRLLHERVDARLPRSWFQRLAKDVLRTSGVELVDEHPVRSNDGTLLAELDLAIPMLRIGVECQSWRWHSTPTARAKDAVRKRRLRLLGWELVDVWWSDLGRIEAVREELAFLIGRQSSFLSVAGSSATS